MWNGVRVRVTETQIEHNFGYHRLRVGLVVLIDQAELFAAPATSSPIAWLQDVLFSGRPLWLTALPESAPPARVPRVLEEQARRRVLLEE